jgi:hypothetical protein
MTGAHEQAEQAEHVEHIAASNKKIALLIAVLALLLALSETLGKSAQTAAISDNVIASDLWNFFQAKTIRQTVMRTVSELVKTDLSGVSDPAIRAAREKQIDAWTKTIARYEDEPKSNEGRKQLMARAQAKEHERDTALARYHHYEIASAAYQIAIVLASAEVITGIVALAWLSGALGVIGLIFTAIGLLAPHAVHLA